MKLQYLCYNPSLGFVKFKGSMGEVEWEDDPLYATQMNLSDWVTWLTKLEVFDAQYRLLILP